MKILFKHKLLQLLILMSFVTSTTSFACSSLVLTNGEDFVLGYNHDWNDVEYCIMTNTRDITKQGLQVLVENDTPAKWTSKYGSITFNFGKEYSMAGMNEKGLIISALMLENGGKTPDKDKRSGIDITGPWVQYQLDNSASIEDVINSNKLIRPVQIEVAPLMHFLVADIDGNVAVIEFLKGEMVVHTGDELPIPLLTNSKYDSDIKKLVEFMKFGSGDKIEVLEESNINDPRIIIGTYMIKKYQQELKTPLVDGAFDILGSITNTDANQFALVFDPVNMQIYYKTKKNSQIRKLDFKDFDLITPSMGLMCSADKNITDVKKDFVPYSTEKNKKYINDFFTSLAVKSEILSDSPEYRKSLEEGSNFYSTYPETFQFPGNKDNVKAKITTFITKIVIKWQNFWN